MRLAHVFLDIAAHDLPSLAGKERKADLAFELAGGQEQSDFHPAADLVEELLVRLEPSDALQVAQLLPIATLVRHHDLRARAALVDRDAPRTREQLEPADRHRVAHGRDVEAELHEGAVRHIVAEQRLGAFSGRSLTILRLQVEALLVREHLRENPAVAVDRRYPDVAQLP